MAKYKPESARIQTLDELDAAIMELGQRERRIEAIDARLQEEIAKLKKKAAQGGESDRDRVKQLASDIGAYAEYHKADLVTAEKKSTDLAHGTIGWRLSTKISIKDTTVSLLRKLGLIRFIRTIEEPDKELMRELDDATLAQVDAVRKTTDTFFVEPKRDAPNADLLKAGA